MRETWPICSSACRLQHRIGEFQVFFQEENHTMEDKIFQIDYQGQELELAAIYRNAGDDLILFIHGLGCAKESFTEAFDSIHLAGFQLLAVDLPGFGDSSRPQGFSYNMEDHAEVLALVLNGMAFRNIHIVAHSMGGAVGLLLADKVLGRLASFVNIEGNLIAEDCGLVSRMTSEVSFEQFRDGMFDRIRSGGPKPWREQSAKSDALGFHRSSVSLVEWSDSGRLLEKFMGLEAEKAYIYGDENASMKILNKLGAIRKISVEASGHFVMNDNPAEFYARLSEIAGKPARKK